MIARPEHRVAEEGQARVGVRAPLGPGGMGEHLLAQVLWKLVEQVRGDGPGLRTVGGRVGDDEVDGLAHGEDPRRLLVGHLHAVGVLELLHERVEVERVGLEVLLEARRLVDARGIDLELVGEMRLDEAEDLFAGHGEATVEGDPDAGAARSACAASSAACVRPTTSPSTPRAASRIAWAMPRRREAPVRHDAEPAQAEQVGAARRSRDRSPSRNSSSAGRSSSAAGLGPRATTSADVADLAQHRPPRRPPSASGRRCR